MNDGKINKTQILPDEISRPDELPDMEKLLKSDPIKVLKYEDLGEAMRGSEQTDFTQPTFEAVPGVKGFKDILDKDGRRHIEIRDINRGTILKVKDL